MSAISPSPKETAGILEGEYRAAPAPYNAELQKRVLDGAQPITRRPADMLEPEMDKLVKEVESLAKEKGFALAKDTIDDVLTYALFPKSASSSSKIRVMPPSLSPCLLPAMLLPQQESQRQFRGLYGIGGWSTVCCAGRRRW